MSFYRSILATLAAMALAMPAFADDAAQANQPAAQSPDAQAAAPTAANTAENAMQKLDVNKASVKELAKLKGLNAAKAKAIVAYRKKNGDFKTLDDLKNVKGFKKLNDEQMKEIQDQLTAG